MSHSFVINSGQSPTGIDIANLSSTLVIESDVASAVDDPGFTNSTGSSFQVGNPFADPPLPVLSTQSDTTVNLGNGDFAVGRLDFSITVEDDPDEGEFDITRRAVVQDGHAEVFLANDPVAASGSSSHVHGRSYRFDNTTIGTISFNIAGLFEAEMVASFDGDDGFARTSGGFEMLFDLGVGSSVTYFPVAPYLVTREDSAPGAEVSELFLPNSGGIDGVFFGGSATAIGDGSDTVARLTAQSRYVMTVTVAAGQSVTMATGFRQSNAVGFAPQMAAVPLPAGLPMLFAGLVGLAVLRRADNR
ncbi:VPLPA-CTERM sorting domain-containing protein [Meridianimarinicoccus aquatilis]|uniref:VPLPA-CTERM sorting domain-containing protein n=1 Tax=Meridianimarinicoccus aquatilis TaxID=2552766 RepID=A0A4R6AZY1_9RHOB|nr:VPLPA-CTERM sorting domain-containing protein [Fluviibacterium aquatile]TDL89364.1 hypothetical protein E2L05_06860 [Fluviibacterium aquatile]